MGPMHAKRSMRSSRVVLTRLTVILPHERLEQADEHVLLDLALELGVRRERAERVVLD
jgi:septum formation topological specificity factor MinE